MIRLAVPSALVALLGLTACATAPVPPPTMIGFAALAGSTGSPVGTARLSAEGDAVTLSVSLTGLPPGTRAMHLHTTGACVAPGFQSAGGHLNPAGRQHGALNPHGSHLGDLPNITIDASGAGEASVALSGTRASLEPVLFDADGTAIVVHAEADDQVSDPTGNAGPRIACGVLNAGAPAP